MQNPNMKLGHPDLHTFEQSLRQLTEIAFNSGVKAIESRGFRLEDTKQDETAMRVFIRGCHYGYDKAQEQIGAAVIALEENIKVAKSQIKELRRSRTEGVNEILRESECSKVAN